MLSSLSHLEFLALAKLQSRIIVFKELHFDQFGAVESFKNIQTADAKAVLLERADPENKRFLTTTIASHAFAQLVIKDDCCELTSATGSVSHFKESPFTALRIVHNDYRAVSSQVLPGVLGGSFGFISYESVKHLPGINELQQGTQPDYIFRFYRDQIHYDYQTHRLTIATVVDVADDQDGYEQALARIEVLESKIACEVSLNVQPSGEDVYQCLAINSHDDRYASMVNRAKSPILAGDIFQMVPSAEFKINIQSKPLAVYQNLRKLSYAPYLCFSHIVGEDIMVASPEVLVNVTGEQVETRPLAGTIRIQPGDDLAARAADLQNSSKDGAEHMMLVDLSRNDLGKIAKANTVKVSALKEVLKLSHVMHLSSTVEGELKEDCDCFDAIAATLPAGTLSGAPKVRAMQIINELEDSPRGYYGGCFCMINAEQDLTSAIAIRMLSIKAGVGTIRAGGGIVHDSDVQEEVSERRNKARMLLEAILLAEKNS